MLASEVQPGLLVVTIDDETDEMTSIIFVFKNDQYMIHYRCFRYFQQIWTTEDTPWDTWDNWIKSQKYSSYRKFFMPGQSK